MAENSGEQITDPVADMPEGGEPTPTPESPQPQEITYELTAPEGLGSDAVERIVSFAKEQGLSNAAAQAILEREAALADEFKTSTLEQVRVEQEKWLAAAENDPEYGGPKFAENVVLAKRGLEKIAAPEVKNLMNSTGLGNHPEIIRMFWKIGKMLQDDSFGSGMATGGNSEQDMAGLFYDNTNKD